MIPWEESKELTASKLRWRSGKGELYTLKTLEDSHLRYIERVLRGGGIKKIEGDDPKERKKVLSLVQKEMVKRDLPQLSMSDLEEMSYTYGMDVETLRLSLMLDDLGIE